MMVTVMMMMMVTVMFSGITTPFYGRLLEGLSERRIPFRCVGLQLSSHYFGMMGDCSWRASYWRMLNLIWISEISDIYHPRLHEILDDTKNTDRKENAYCISILAILLTMSVHQPLLEVCYSFVSNVAKIF